MLRVPVQNKLHSCLISYTPIFHQSASFSWLRRALCFCGFFTAVVGLALWLSGSDEWGWVVEGGAELMLLYEGLP